MHDAEARFEAFVREAAEDPNIVGIVLGGSRGRQALVTPESYFDVYVVVPHPALVDAYAEKFPSRHGDEIEYLISSLDSFRQHALPGTSDRWNAYTFAHVEPLIDKLDGELRRLIAQTA